MQQMVITCESCGFQNAVGQRFCNNCGVKLPEIAAPPPSMPQQPVQQAQQQQAWVAQPAPGAAAAPTGERIAAKPRKYVLLGIAAIIFKIIGWVVLVGGILGSVATALLASQGAMPGLADLMDRGMALVGVSGVAGAGMVALALVGIIGSLLLGFGLLAFAELSNAVMAIHDNVRV